MFESTGSGRVTTYEVTKFAQSVAIYSIKDLEKLSGIKAHTLRIWEQRYEIIQPKRTNTNIRYYEDEELKLVLNIALLNRNGIKISKIANMSKQEIADKVAAISEINFEYGTQLDALTISMIEMDEYKFDRIINTNIRQLGFERTMLEVIYPFLDKLSVLWLTGSVKPAQESFISYLIRQKIIVAIDKEPLRANNNGVKFLLYMPRGERQELSMLFMQYLLKSRDAQVVYIGQETSLGDLMDAYKIHQPDQIFTMITETFTREPVQQYVDELSKRFPDAIILVSGYQVVVQGVPSTGNVRVLSDLQSTMHYLDSELQLETDRS